ncbi:cytochrome C biogenesis protein [Myxococcota bacterium]|nr:cytochrome C biogenesis protein [Myxococcota bacterium]MBU1431697.1 cytochrome C biogenesis protein [Myxococcota bacterium]MBU1898885.1 cytochrome C biogenesis protein [Myxococcota bacterium]
MDLASLSQALERATWMTPLAALLWGLASVGLSACHLSSVPLLVTFLARIDGQTLSPARLSLLVTVGISLSLALIAALTWSLGRMLGDLWGLGPWLMIALLLLGGLNLMGVLTLPSVGRLDPNKVSVGPRSALASGGILGLTLGPCTFAFFAPVLALTGAPASGALIAAAIAAFVLGHLGLTWLLGVAGAALGARLARGARLAKLLKVSVGVAAVAFALHLIRTAP